MEFNKKDIETLKQKFDDILNIEKDESIEFWYARDLQKVLGYNNWQNFIEVINKAMLACKNAGIEIENHFIDINKMVTIGSNAVRKVQDYMLTRYACYLIAQNGDSKKQEIAFAQTYFAVQTRKQEIIEDRIKLMNRLEARDRLKESEKQLSKNIYERGVDDKGFAIIRSRGDSALFGGLNTSQMKDKYGIKENRPLADFLPTLTIAAKNLATEMTNHNVIQEDLYGQDSISNEHVQNNLSVRNMLSNRGIQPENLKPAEDLKKLERRVKSEEKRFIAVSKKTLDTKIIEKNFSYLMGVDNIDKLKENNFEIKLYDSGYGVSFKSDKAKIFEDYIYETLKNGFWNEYLGKEKIFIFKFKDGRIKKYILNNENEKEILKLCEEFADCKFESIDKMLRDNMFYAEKYYKNDK